MKIVFVCSDVWDRVVQRKQVNNMSDDMERTGMTRGTHIWGRAEPDFQSWLDLVRHGVPSNAPRLQLAIEAFLPVLRRTGWVILRNMGFRNLELEVDRAVGGWFVRLYGGALARYDRTSPFVPFGYRLFLNTCVDMGRQRNKHRATSLAVEVSDRRQLAERNRDELREEVQTTIDRMSREDHRQALTVVYVEGLNPREAAARLKVESSKFNRMTFNARQVFKGDFIKRGTWVERR